MPFVERRLTSPTTLSTVASTVYTVPSQYTTIIKQVVVTNTTASPASFNLYIGSATAANAIFSNTTVSANDSLIINLSQVLSSLEILTASANANSAINMTISGVENNGPLDPAGVYIADGSITTSKLANSSVTSAKIGANAVTNTAILDDAVSTSKIANSAITTDKIAANAVVTADIANNAITQAKIDTTVPLSGMRNFIINGNMLVAQRGGTVTTSNGYTLDRWHVNSGANATMTQSSDSAGNTGNSPFSLKAVASGTQQIFVRQAIETFNATQLAGKTVILSAYAAGISNTTNLNMSLGWSTLTDNSITGTWTEITPSSGGNLTLGATMTRFTGIFSVPSNARSLRVQFVNNTANFTVNQGFYLGDVQLEQGSQVTPFEHRPYGTELQLCQRYYVRYTNWGAYTQFFYGMATSTSNVRAQISFPVPMRTINTGLVIDSSAVGTFRVVDGVFATNPTAFQMSTSNQGFTTTGLDVNTSASLVQYRPYWIDASNQTPGSAYIGFSAEL